MNETVNSVRGKKNNFKSGKAWRRKHARQHEADNRASIPRAEGAFLGTKEKVKAGIITACEGLSAVSVGTKTYNWLLAKKKQSGCK